VELIASVRGSVAYCQAVDPDGRERLVVVCKQTYRIPMTPCGELDLVSRADQLSLVDIDTFTGDPSSSAPLIESEFAAFKPRCDLLLVGSAHAPAGQPTPSCEVGLSVGAVSKRFRVHGRRVWSVSMGHARPTPSVPFKRMPISYDIAFGGTVDDPERPGEQACYCANPVGIGYYPFGLAELDGLPAPSTEALDEPLSSPRGAYRPMALGVIGRSWMPRLPLAGTYDDRWLAECFPFLPKDFDVGFFQSAPPDQQIAYPAGEIVTLMNLTPAGHTSFRLPRQTMPVEFARRHGPRVATQAALDTIQIFADEELVTLTWRASLALRSDLSEVPEVVFGPMPSSFHRARSSGKDYFRSLGELVSSRAAAGLGSG
jgi:hypothetical protein